MRWKGFERLPESAAAAIGDRDGNHHRQPDAARLEIVFDGRRQALRFNVSKTVSANSKSTPFDQGGRLLVVGFDKLIGRLRISLGRSRRGKRGRPVRQPERTGKPGDYRQGVQIR